MRPELSAAGLMSLIGSGRGKFRLGYSAGWKLLTQPRAGLQSEFGGAAPFGPGAGGVRMVSSGFNTEPAQGMIAGVSIDLIQFAIAFLSASDESLLIGVMRLSGLSVMLTMLAAW